MGVELWRSRSELNTVVLQWLILHFFWTISGEIVFGKDENATLVPYSLTTQKVVTVLPENSTIERAGGQTTELKHSDARSNEIQPKLSEKLRRNTTKAVRANFTLPTLHTLVRGSARRKAGHRKKEHHKGAVLSFPDRTKDLWTSAENESESRSYNYDPTYPVYNYGPTPDSSGEDFMSNFGMVKDMWTGYPDQEPQNPTFPSLTTTYTPKIVQSPPVHGDYFGDWRPPPPGPPRFRRPGMDEPSMYLDYMDDTRVINLDALGRYWHPAHPPVVIRTGFHRFQDEDSIEYQPYRDGSEHHGWDYSKLAIWVLVKIGLLKLKLFLLLKLALLLLIKMKLLLMALFLKLLIVMKGAKLLKLLFIPFLLATLIPFLGMLLMPLLALLPMLLNYIINNASVPAFLPDEDAAPETRTEDDAEVSESSRSPLSSATLLQFKMILSSEECLKRIVCEMAVQRRSGIKSILISRLLDFVSAVVPHRKVKTYVNVYKSGLYQHQNQTEPWCSTKYECSLIKNRTVSS